jgi:hypothetical protein
MESVSKTFKNISKSILPKSIIGKKSRKNRANKYSKSSQSSASKSRSRSRSKQTSSNSSSPTRKFRKNVKQVNGNLINVNKLVKDVDTLHKQSQSVFRKQKRKNSPDSPIILTVKNLDTGKTANATVIKDLNTGKYELYNLSGSK